MRLALLISACLAVAVLEGVQAIPLPEVDWSGVDAVLERSVAQGVFPGCVALVGDKSGILYEKAFGHYTYDVPPPYTPAGTPQGSIPPMSTSTRFDMASCTKVTATVSVAAILYQDGFLSLEDRVCSPSLLGSGFATAGKENITVLNLMLHNAGFPPDPEPNYWDPDFGCPQTSKPVPAENFSCRDLIYSSLLNQTLINPVGAVFLYSDISFITLMFVVGRIIQTQSSFYGISKSDLLPNCATGSPSDTQCWYEAFVRLKVFEPLGMSSSQFNLPASEYGTCAPTEDDTTYEHKQIQGQVSDGNAYALGGIAGHAGLFSTASDLFTYISAYLFPNNQVFLNATTIKKFITEYNHTQSSRALGWDTNDPAVDDEGFNRTCGNLSDQTFMHTGYTGTLMCGDPVNQIATVLLTNRCYPNDTEHVEIMVARQQFSAAVVSAINLAKVRRLEHFEQQYEQYLHESKPVLAETAVIPYTYPLFKQCDPRWGSDVMQIQTICEVGCLMSDVSMALNGKNISVSGHDSNPGVLNTWLQNNNGYAGNDELEESAVVNISPNRITWVGSYTPDELPYDKVTSMLDQLVICIANVMEGRHFVLVTGYDKKDNSIWYVNDPGFNLQTYNTTDVVGWRIFDMS